MYTLIVARTRVGDPNLRCIGGIAYIDNRYRSVRLLNPDQLGPTATVNGSRKGFWPHTAPFRIGEVWDLEFDEPGNIEPPHTEDLIVRNHTGPLKTLQGRRLDTRLRQIVPIIRPEIFWVGGPDRLFEGSLLATSRGKRFIERGRESSMSTGFWNPGCDLILTEPDSRTYQLQVGSSCEPRNPMMLRICTLPYVGEPDPVDTIPAGTLLRVSLARWWSPEDGPERCYLMLSGWF